MGLTEKHWFEDELTTIPKGNLRRLFLELEELHREVDKIKQNTQIERKGKWLVSFPYSSDNSIRECSVCHVTQSVNLYKGEVRFKFCPYCGADMRGEKE